MISKFELSSPEITDEMHFPTQIKSKISTQIFSIHIFWIWLIGINNEHCALTKVTETSTTSTTM